MIVIVIVLAPVGVQGAAIRVAVGVTPEVTVDHLVAVTRTPIRVQTGGDRGRGRGRRIGAQTGGDRGRGR